MSFADPSADPVQPEGQGGEGTSDAPYAEYLNRIPEEVRGDVEPVFRDWDANTTRRFQEAAEYRKTWEPYEQLGVQNTSPEDLQQLFEFQRGLHENPQGTWEQMRAWAQEQGLLEEQQQQGGEEEPWVDPSVQSLVEQQLQSQLGPLGQQLQQITEWMQSQEANAATAQHLDAINSKLEELKSKHSDFDEGLVEKFIANHFEETDGAAAVEKAWADAQAFRASVEKQVLGSKMGLPPANAGGGTPDGAGPPKTMEEANAQALAQLRAARIGS